MKLNIPQEFKNITGEIIQINYPRQGYTSTVGILETENGIFTVKHTNQSRYNLWLDHEIKVLNEIQDSPFKVPKVYSYYKENEKRYALLEHIEGETLRSVLNSRINQSTKDALLFEFGSILKKIHDRPCPNDLISEKLWLDRMLEEATINMKLYNCGSIELLKHLKENKPVSIPQTFIHGDFTIDNVIVNNNKVSGVIDWSGGDYGDPRYDVALAIRPKEKSFITHRDRELFFQGYGNSITKEEFLYFENNGLYAFL